MNGDADVVICGGGVIGLATAYYLGKRGVAVLVIEADSVASGASGAAAGLLSQPSLEQLRGPQGALLQASFDAHLELAGQLPDESGVNYEFARSGMLQVSLTEAEERADRQRVEEERAAGMATRWLEPAEARELCGWIDLPIRGALLPPANGQLDAYRFSLALLAAAERMGAKFRTGRVSGIERVGDRLTGVYVAQELIPCRAAVFAMGPWMSEVAPWFGMRVPIAPLKGQIVHVRTPGTAPRYGFVDHGGNYATPKASGLTYLGTTEEAVGFDSSPTRVARDQILAFALSASSVLGESEVLEQTACLRPLSADEQPIISAVDGLVGAFVGGGHGRKGVMLAPVTGQLLAQLVLGDLPTFDLTPFALGRFGS